MFLQWARVFLASLGIILTRRREAGLTETGTAACARIVPRCQVGEQDSVDARFAAYDRPGREHCPVHRRHAVQLPARVCDIQSYRPLALPLSGRQKAVVRMFVEGGFIAENATASRRHRRTVIRQNHDAPKTLGVTNDHGLFSPVQIYCDSYICVVYLSNNRVRD